MWIPVIWMAVSAVMILGGVALSQASFGFGFAVFLVGVVGFFGLLVYAWVRAWSSNQGDMYTPGKAHRQMREEREAAAREAARKQP